MQFRQSNPTIMLRPTIPPMLATVQVPPPRRNENVSFLFLHFRISMTKPNAKASHTHTHKFSSVKSELFFSLQFGDAWLFDVHTSSNWIYIWGPIERLTLRFSIGKCIVFYCALTCFSIGKCIVFLLCGNISK